MMCEFVARSTTFFFRVSQLAHFSFCPKRAKIEIFEHPDWGPYQAKHKDMAKGSEMHAEYSAPYKSWDRRLLRYQLDCEGGPIFHKQVDNITIRGQYDDLRILSNNRDHKKLVSFVELKTTRKGFLFPSELESAIFQLQIYVWLMKDLIKEPYVLHKRHYLEIISQQTGQLIKRIPVYEDPDIEDKIRFILRVFMGLEEVKRPPRHCCKHCPRPITDKCTWYKEQLGL